MAETKSLIDLEPNAGLGVRLVRQYKQDLLAQYEARDKFQLGPADEVDSVRASITDPSVLACVEFVLSAGDGRRRIAAEMLSTSVRSAQLVAPDYEDVTWLKSAERPLRPEVGKIAVLMIQTHDPGTAKESSGTAPTPRIAGLDWTRVTDAYNRIAALWPAAALEMHSMISRIAGVTGTPAKNFSVRKIPLVIFLNRESVSRDEVDILAQRLVHETGHQVLNLADRFVPLTMPSDRVVKSPLRIDLRPIPGVIHQAFALTRMVGYWRHVPEQELTEVTRMERERRKRDLSQAIGLLRDAPELTSAGHDLVGRIEAWHNGATDLRSKGCSDG